MRIKEILLDSFINSRLFEMGYERKKVFSKLEELQENVALHLVEVLMFGNVYSSNGWKKEINAWLRYSQSKGSKSEVKLTKRDFMRIFFEEPLGSIDDVQITMNEAFAKNSEYVIEEPDPVELHKRLREVMLNITDDMSELKFTNVEDYL